MHFLILYFVACLLIGFAGRKRRIGSIGFFLVSLFLTPVLGLLILLLSAPVPSASAR